MSEQEDERRDEARDLLRHALEQVVDELGARLREGDILLPAEAVPAVSEALTSAYVRGLDRGMRQAARDLEERMAELGVTMRAIVDDPADPEDPPLA